MMWRAVAGVGVVLVAFAFVRLLGGGRSPRRTGPAVLAAAVLLPAYLAFDFGRVLLTEMNARATPIDLCAFYLMGFFSGCGLCFLLERRRRPVEGPPAA